MDIETANDILKIESESDAALLGLVASGKEFKTADYNLPPQAYCPICQSDMLEIEEISENDAERGVFKYKCLACGTEFYLLENLIASCRRGIENAENEIEYNKNKIKYFNNKMGGA